MTDPTPPAGGPAPQQRLHDQPPQYAPSANGQPSYPPPPVAYYPQPVYIAAAPPQPRGKSIASMVLGIVSVFFGYIVIAPLIGLILGLTGLKSEPAGRGMAIAGVILNGLMLLGWVVFIIIIVISLFGFATAATVSSY